MDVNFSLRSQALTLTSTSPLVSLSSILSTRGEFLGYSHKLRPPSMFRISRKCRKLGFTDRAHRVYFKASLESNTVLLVVAVTAFTAVSVALLNHYVKLKNSAEIPNSKFTLSQLGNNIIEFFIGGKIMNAEDLHQCSLPKGSESSIDNNVVYSDENAEKESFVQLHKSLVHDDCRLLNESDSLSTDSSNGKYSLIEKSVATADPSCTHSLLCKTEVMDPPNYASGVSELPYYNDRNETVFKCELSQPTMKIEPIGSLVFPAIRPHSVSDIDGKSYHKLGENGGANSNSHISVESAREELHTFCVSSKKRPSTLNGLRASSFHASPLSLQGRHIVKHAEMLTQDSCHAAEHLEDRAHVAFRNGNSFRSSKHSRRAQGLSQDHGSKPLIKSSHTVIPKFSHPNGTDSLDKYHSEDNLGTYGRLLRDGRLTDSIDLLEDMEKKGVLDMNKIYHAKFYKICKSRKAIREAFRFTKLVQEPTLSTFNMLMTVCASSQDSEGAFRVMQLAQEAGLKADCKLYTTLISTCAKSGKVDAMFEVFHEMVNAEVEPNVHTYGALIDGCAKAGQVAKAFGAYGIMRSKNVKPDRIVFNALITACGQSGAVDRAFDVLSEMRTEVQPVDPDHVTVGALIMACTNAGQVDRAQEAYKMIHDYSIKGTPEVYTIAVNSCSQNGDLKFAIAVYEDMKKNGIAADEVFLSALIDVAGHAGKLDDAFQILTEANVQGIRLGTVSYSSLMGACSNAKNWQKALELFENIKLIRLNPTVSTMNALITALCEGDQLPKAMDILSEMKNLGLRPNNITYSILSVASERKDDLEGDLMLLSLARKDGISPTFVMCRSITGMCLQRFEKASAAGEPVLSFKSENPYIENEWTSQALMVYRDTIKGGVLPNTEIVSQVLGCLRVPSNSSVKERLIENLRVTADSPKQANLCALIDGFGEYDPRAFSLLEEASSLGIVPCVSFKDTPVVVDTRNLHVYAAEVYLLTVLKGLKNRLAAGAKLSTIQILLPVDEAKINFSKGGEKTINLAGRISQAIAALLRRLCIPYQGNESYGKIRINGPVLKRWFQPKLASSPFSVKRGGLSSSQLRLGKEINNQQRKIRTGNLSLD